MNKACFVVPLLLGCISAKYGNEAAVEVNPSNDSATSTADSADPPVDDTGEDGTGFDVVLGAVQGCEDPIEETKYSEQAISLGVDTEWFDPDSPGGHEDGPSLSMADANEDGFYDWAVFRMEQGDSNMYMGDASGFRLWPAALYQGRAGLFIDLNHDERLDLMVGGAIPFTRIQNGDGSWVSGGFPALDPDNEETASIIHNFTVGDFDSDGSVDVYAVRTASPFGQGTVHNDRVLKVTEGGLTVSMDSVPEHVGLRHGFDGLAFDEDGDGDTDIYLVHDHGATVGPSTLLRNDNGVLRDATDDCFCSLQVSAKGVDLADFNRDGQPDLFVTGVPLNTLLSRIGDSWVDVSDATRIQSQVWEGAAGWGGVFMDFNNDGWKDIFVAQGDRWNPGQIDLPDGSPAQFDVPLRLLRQDEGEFTDVAQSMGLDAMGSFRSVLPVDINRDGVEDLIVTQASQRTLVYVSDGCTAQNWVEIHAPIGSRVRVESASGIQTDWSRIDRGYESTAWIPLHFGLGPDAVIDAITVDYPDGHSQRLEGPIDARRVIRFIR